MGAAQYVHESLPLCFVGSYDLRDLFRKFAGKDDPDYLSVVHVINEERECSGFIKWQQGFTPKEHREMMDREKILAWQTEREESDRKWRAEQESKNRRFYLVAALSGAIVGALLTYLATHLTLIN